MAEELKFFDPTIVPERRKDEQLRIHRFLDFATGDKYPSWHFALCITEKGARAVITLNTLQAVRLSSFLLSGKSPELAATEAKWDAEPDPTLWERPT